ncbi:MAG TPA: response regulator transcription factor [Bryobacteraceae bacterium]|jgi:DNA-binding response OmpR family regulator|nr:response regulator transcription factor [Bryobacteraceae bacterium]
MTSGRILIVDDDVPLAGMLVELLAGENFQSAHASNGAAALAFLARRSFDLLILDVMMATMDGLELLRRLRKEANIPVLVLTALADEKDRILALELGADDCLVKPFSVRELVARLRAILRRSANGRPDSAPLALGALAIYPATMSATLAGVPVRLTTAEFMLLEALARSAGRVQSRETLTYQALGRPLEPFDRSIDTHISNIRRKLCLDPGRGIEIKSSRGHGYVLTVAPGRA